MLTTNLITISNSIVSLTERLCNSLIYIYIYIYIGNQLVRGKERLSYIQYKGLVPQKKRDKSFLRLQVLFLCII